MTTHSAHGFVSYDASGTPTFLPLRSVTARVNIIDVSARVVLTQLFANERRNPECASAQYIFPVPASGAVCAFKMQTADGCVVTGVVKERSKAEQEYEIAISKNQFAGLVYEATPDVFVISIGAIPRAQDVEVTIMYVVALTDGDLPGYDQIQFTLPTYVATRYGTAPPAADAGSSAVNTVFGISVDIQMPSEIMAVSSMTHSIKVHPGHSTSANNTTRSVFTAKVTLDPAGPPPRLNRDFVLSIQASKLGEPRCVAERRVLQKTVALSLTFVPRFRMEPIAAQEYVFLIDRSGSMNGKPIHHAKEALTLFLKSLPSQGTIFNIFSFGSTCSPMWPSSHQYTASDIQFALEYVQSMNADYGGTEIKSALAHCLRSRSLVLPTSVFLVTDGEVWDHQDIYTLVGNEVSNAAQPSNGAHLRVFTLGVGDAASTALCEGVARVGNGLCLMSTDGADLTHKCARLLLASTIPTSGSSKDVEIDWGYIPSNVTNIPNVTKHKAGKGKGKVTILCDDNYDPLATVGPQVVLPDPPFIQQAPSHIPDLYPANRFTVFAILSNTTEIPKTVALRGQLPDGSTIVLPPVQVHQTIDQDDDLPPIIHTLAANRLIQELEDGITESQGSFDVNDRALREAVIHTAIIRFSETYQLASKFASFIAVDYGRKSLDPDDSNSGDVTNNGNGSKPTLENRGINNLGKTKYDDDDDDGDEGDDDQLSYFDADNATSTHMNNGGYLFPSNESKQPPQQRTSSEQTGYVVNNGGGSFPSNQSKQTPHQGTSSGQTGYAANSSAWKYDTYTSQPTKKSVSFTPALSPLVIQPTSTTTESKLSRTHGHGQPTNKNDTQYMYDPQTTIPHRRGLGTANTAQTTHGNSSRPTGYSSSHVPGHGARYIFDVVANRDALRQTPSTDSLLMPGAYPIIDRAAPSRASTYHSSAARSIYSIDQQWSGSRPYILETVACSEMIFTGMVGLYDTTDTDSPAPTRPLYLLSASSKSGLYKAPRHARPSAIAPAPWTTAPPIVAAARLQSFDGSFDLDANLHTLLGKKVSFERLRAVIPAAVRGQQNAEKIWATVLAAAHLKKAFPNDKEVWIGLWNKAADYVRSKLGVDVSFALLVDEATKFL